MLKKLQILLYLGYALISYTKTQSLEYILALQHLIVTTPLTKGPRHLSTRCGLIPSCAAATAVALAWFDCILPHVMTLSQPLLTASAMRNSSFRT